MTVDTRLVPDLEENSFSPIEYDVSSELIIYCMIFIILRFGTSISTLLRVCIINGCWILPSAFSASIDHVIFILRFVCVVYHIH